MNFILLNQPFTLALIMHHPVGCSWESEIGRPVEQLEKVMPYLWAVQKKSPNVM